jgi:ABC-type microcin C transport system duplicated ATPase subunit YejF
MAVIGLLPSYAMVSGSVRLGRQELLDKSDADMSKIRGARIGTVFQDPMSALTPVYTVGDQIAEAVTVHHREVSARDARRRAIEARLDETRALIDCLELTGPAAQTDSDRTPDTHARRNP